MQQCQKSIIPTGMNTSTWACTNTAYIVLHIYCYFSAMIIAMVYTMLCTHYGGMCNIIIITLWHTNWVTSVVHVHIGQLNSWVMNTNWVLQLLMYKRKAVFLFWSYSSRLTTALKVSFMHATLTLMSNVYNYACSYMYIVPNIKTSCPSIYNVYTYIQLHTHSGVWSRPMQQIRQ